MTSVRTFEEITAAAVDEVGGKGLSLGLMAAAGLPVPAGFCVTSAVHRRLRGQAPDSDPTLVEELAAAYQRLGSGVVAVRSSATAEDGAAASFAGQQETILGVTGEAAVIAAVGRCWDSLDSERAVAYRTKQGVDAAGLAMAVVVQRLVPSEISGVLFTRDPLDATGRRMLVESSWGLGESVVAGKVTPDRFQLDHDTGALLERSITIKSTMITATGPEPVPAEKQRQASLTDGQLAELAELGRRVEAYYGDARDIEWAWAEGRFWLLQARPITTAGAAERAQVRLEEIAALRAMADPAGTVWSRFNLSEILPEPTPMTWAIVRRFMSGKGGFGLMYRDLGFEPDPSLDEAGIYDLVCGRPFCNLSREPRMISRSLPFEHPFAVLKADPAKAVYPQPILNPARGGWRFYLFFPIIAWKLFRSAGRPAELSRTTAERLRTELFPTFKTEVDRAAAQDLQSLSSDTLLARLQVWTWRTLVDFARESLKPTALAGIALANLERALLPTLGAEQTRAALGELVMGLRPDPEADLPTAVKDLAEGRLDRKEFLQRFGHRGSNEMELAHPRWAEQHADLERLTTGAESAAAPVPKQEYEASDFDARWQKLVAEAKIPLPQQTALTAEATTLHRYLGLRETAKHYLMQGYAQIRRILVELDRRQRLNGGIFFLVPDELSRLIRGEDFSAVIAERRRRRALALSLEVPAVLFSDDLDAIDRPLELDNATTLHGSPLSAGVAQGPALVLTSPDGVVPPTEPYVLVCPSTDPAWVPLFVHAKALVMETGGVLSHGAIVAREFGLPAVAGLPDIVRRLRTGQQLRVDGGRGTVSLLSGSA